MAELLKPGVYGTETNPVEGPFGLRCAQLRDYPRLAHNGGWYNAAGQKIGWGDLGPEDIGRIAAEIPPGELFIILGEKESHWAFHRQAPLAHAMVNITEQAPGQDYVARHAHFIITAQNCYAVDEYESRQGHTTTRYNGVVFQVLSAHEAMALVTSSGQPN